MASNPCVLQLIIMVFSFGSFIKQTTAEFTCDKESYVPCSCVGLVGSDANYVECDQILVQDVISVFNRTQAIELAELSIAKNRADDVIPSNFISNKKAGKLQLFCYDSDSTTKTNIEKDAFNSTKQYTTILELSSCRLRDSDLSFLDGFDKLSYLRMDYFDEMGRLFPTFPSNFPEIKNFKFTRCVGWDTLVLAPSPVVGSKKLKRLDITQSVDMNDDVMNLVMEWAVQSFNSTLDSLYIYTNNLTRIPPQIEFFRELVTLDMKNNFFHFIPSHSLKFNSDDLDLVDLSNCGVEEIEPNAFEGKFKEIFVDLSGNSLTRLESFVFEDIILSGGSIDVYKNPLNCNEDPCHLAWIFNQNLLEFIFNAACSNGTLLKDLDLESFAECYVFSTNEVSTSKESTNQKTSQEAFESTTSDEIFNSWFITSKEPTGSSFQSPSTTNLLATTYYSSMNESRSVPTIWSTIFGNGQQTSLPVTASPQQNHGTMHDFSLNWIFLPTFLCFLFTF